MDHVFTPKLNWFTEFAKHYIRQHKLELSAQLIMEIGLPKNVVNKRTFVCTKLMDEKGDRQEVL